MQAIQKDATKDGVVWLTIISSAPGEQGHVAPKKANELTKSRGAAPTAVLLDPDGKVGRQYDARVTPHMFVIDKAGMLQYMGGIDDKASSNPADIKIRQALRAFGSGIGGQGREGRRGRDKALWLQRQIQVIVRAYSCARTSAFAIGLHGMASASAGAGQDFCALRTRIANEQCWRTAAIWLARVSATA